MTEWASALLVFWVLWLVDGLKLPPSDRFGVIGRGRRARLWYARLLFPGWNPAAWRTVVADIPFTLSPAGICNRPAGSAGRPVEAPARAAAWAWADVRETGVKGGWILINGARFCRDTGHLGARQILGLARLEETARTTRITWWVHRWVRPAHLRRRARVLAGRTITSVWCNTLFLGLAAAITIYLATNAASRIPLAWSDALARTLPLLVGYLLLLHVIAMVATSRAVRRLKVAGEDKRTVALFSAALLPPQALRLRGLAGEGWFPAQHPLAHALAFARKPELAALAFQTLGDLRWPLGEERDPPLAREIVRWHRAALTEKFGPLLASAGIAEAELFYAPGADGPDSRSYCPRCGSQFATEAARCPHGVGLEPVVRAKP
jgi:hypothetical protein